MRKATSILTDRGILVTIRKCPLGGRIEMRCGGTLQERRRPVRPGWLRQPRRARCPNRAAADEASPTGFKGVRQADGLNAAAAGRGLRIICTLCAFSRCQGAGSIFSFVCGHEKISTL